MKYGVILFFVVLLLCQSAYAGEIKSTRTAVRAERKAADIKVVMYMTSW